jgi:hypothetical protein
MNRRPGRASSVEVFGRQQGKEPEGFAGLRRLAVAAAWRAKNPPSERGGAGARLGVKVFGGRAEAGVFDHLLMILGFGGTPARVRHVHTRSMSALQPTPPTVASG